VEPDPFGFEEEGHPPERGVNHGLPRPVQELITDRITPAEGPVIIETAWDDAPLETRDLPG
jgi:hypothetical protein